MPTPTVYVRYPSLRLIVHPGLPVRGDLGRDRTNLVDALGLP
jgi:hypothetical protein